MNRRPRSNVPGSPSLPIKHTTSVRSAGLLNCWALHHIFLSFFFFFRCSSKRDSVRVACVWEDNETTVGKKKKRIVLGGIIPWPAYKSVAKQNNHSEWRVLGSVYDPIEIVRRVCASAFRSGCRLRPSVICTVCGQSAGYLNQAISNEYGWTQPDD